MIQPSLNKDVSGSARALSLPYYRVFRTRTIKKILDDWVKVGLEKGILRGEDKEIEILSRTFIFKVGRSLCVCM